MRVVLITGASSGIGKELARQFAYRGYNLLLVARRADLLKQLADDFISEFGITCDYVATDICENAKQVYDYVIENNYEVTALINNAGFGDYGRFDEADLEKLLNMIDLNNKALVELTYYFIPEMKKLGYGHILNVGSVASFMPGPYMAVYYATKAFVLSFSMSLREELRKDNIKVSVLCPAPTKSAFWKVAGGENAGVIENNFARTSTDAAITGFKLFESGKAYAIDGTFYKIMIEMTRHMPIEMVARIMHFVQSKTKSKA